MRLEHDFNPEDIDEKVTINVPLQSPNILFQKKLIRPQSTSTHRRMLEDLENYIQDNKNKENERIRNFQDKQKHIGEEINRRQEMKETKRKNLEEVMKKKELLECTFKPKVNENKAKRNFHEFIQNQYTHSQKVKEKTEQLKKSIQERDQEQTHKPKINNSYSRKKDSTESLGTVFNRLYSLSEKEKVLVNEPAGTFHPVINVRSKNMIREVPVEDMLYGDALRRQEKDNEILLTSTSDKNEKPVNFANEKYAAKKFLKEYFHVLEELQVNTSFNTTIEYATFNELLKRLGFVSCEEDQLTKPSSIERGLVDEAYQMLQNFQVNARNVSVFMLGLLGIYHINPVNFEEGENIDEDKELNLDEIEGRKIQKQFDLFFRNRLSSDASRRIEEKRESYSFKPNTNKQSNILAEKFRNTMLEEANQLLQECPELEFTIPQDGVITHTDLLILHKMAQQLKKEKMKEVKFDEELKQCTFKPITYNSSLKNSKITDESFNAGSKKSRDLYEYHRELKSRKESLQASRHENINPECTFKPIINKSRPPQSPSVPLSKQTEETLFRLHKGREKYEEKQRFLERGEKLKESKTRVKTEVTPILILDVNLGEKMDRIVLYSGDEHKIEQITDSFAKTHSLDEQSKQKLFELVKLELGNVLDSKDKPNEDFEF